MTPARATIWTAAVIAWLAVVMAGLGALMTYDSRPGAAAHAPLHWPADSALVRDVAGPTLIMLAHPRCDCTRASLGELAELLARSPQRPRTFVVFIRPAGTDDGWTETSLSSAAERIPGVTVVRDSLGAEARRFGVETSGQTLLYGPDGRLMFAGGATGARGKPGDNAGRATLLALLNGQGADRTSTPVFGCPLFGPADEVRGTGGHSHGSSPN